MCVYWQVVGKQLNFSQKNISIVETLISASWQYFNSIGVWLFLSLTAEDSGMYGQSLASYTGGLVPVRSKVRLRTLVTYTGTAQSPASYTSNCTGTA